MKENLVLIGMPGSGKSTVGPKLAEMLSYSFVDTDRLIEKEEKRSLQEIVGKEGPETLRRIEANLLLSLRLRHYVISTGGSAVYSAPAMNHLKTNGIIIFLYVTMKSLKGRLENIDQRGIARQRGQSLEDLFTERHPLYTTYADMILDTSSLSPDEVCERILNQLKEKKGFLPLENPRTHKDNARNDKSTIVA